MVDFADDTTTELERRLGPLKVVSIVESCTYVALLAFWIGGSRVGTLLLGSMHGMVVMAFAGMVLLIFRPLGWSLPFALFAILTGPIGALTVFERLRREEPAIRAREQSRRAANAADTT
ncbi:MAG: DUF3817 domain-containing protein [Acidimicrobiales bacterium]